MWAVFHFLSRNHLQRYYRWGIEITFRDRKQHLGFAETSARTAWAVQRSAPFVGLLYTLVVLWYAEAGHRSRWDVWPCRSWYRRKLTPSFEDMLWALRRALIRHTVPDLAHALTYVIPASPHRTCCCDAA